MELAVFQRRVAARNPLEPYSWEARYRGTGRLRQFDHDGYHFSHEIDRGRLAALVVLGHPDSPIVLPVPYADGRVVDHVIVKAQVSLTQQLGVAAPGASWDRAVRCFFGFRYGEERFVLEIDELGRLFKTNGEG
jgi:hypothetical protein